MSLVEVWRAAKPCIFLSDGTWLAFTVCFVAAGLGVLFSIFHVFSLAYIFLSFAILSWFGVCYGTIQDVGRSCQ